MDSQILISGAVTVGVGALSGGITNAVAVWMLFHPHEPLRLGPFSLHGAIPKNKARLARSVGRTVGERLLTAEDLSHRLAEGGFRAAFDAAITGGMRGLLARNHGSLAEALGPAALAAVEGGLPALADRIAERIASSLEGPETAPAVTRLLTGLADRLADQPIGAVLGPDARAALHTRVEGWARSVASGEELAGTLREVIGGALERLTGDDRPLVERLPAGMVAALEQAIADSLPTVLERVGDALEQSEARVEVLAVMREEIDRAVRGLLLHQRLLARLVMTDAALASLLDTFAGEGADRLARELRHGPLQVQLRQRAADAVHAALRVPLGERLRRLGPDGRRELAGNLAALSHHALGSEAFRNLLARALDRFLQEADQRTWGDLLRAVPAGQVATLLAEWLGRPEGRRWLSESVEGVLRTLLGRPLGRPADWLGDEATSALAQATADAAWRWVHDQLPEVIGHLQVQEMVEQKVLGFSTQRMEEIVRNVTQRELDLIVRLGYWLGALVGLAAFGVNLLFR